MRAVRFLFLGGVLSVAFLGAFGCQSIADIEQRTFSDEASPQCQKYCDTVKANCTGDFQVYKTDEICLDVCKNLELGDSEASGNTVACRQNEADAAKLEKSSCANAGPGGNGVCGTDCEAWCGLLEKACPDDFDTLGGECEQRCKALADDDGFSVGPEYYDGDTLQCRLIHVGAALSVPETHCSHAAFVATEHCIPGEAAEPTCKDLCRTTQAICAGDLAVWESTEQCLAACDVFDVGTSGDETGNTVACRQYHATTAGIALPDTHCKHAGPTGDGHCGKYDADAGKTGNCESYCKLLEAACKDDPGYTFADSEACENACESDLASKGAKAESGYSVKTSESGDTLQCRTLQAVRALEAGNTDACAGALSGDPCQ